jgi:SulP family sulfate permease
VGLSVLVFLYKSMRPKVATLSLYDRTYRDASHFNLGVCEHVAVVRFDGPLFFANASYLEDQVTRHLRSKPHLRAIIIVAHGINDMDASGEEALSLLVDRVRSAGYEISIAGLNETVTAVLRRTHLWEKIGEEFIFHTLPEAIEVVHPRAHGDSREEMCPLRSVTLLDARREGEMAAEDAAEEDQSCR